MYLYLCIYIFDLYLWICICVFVFVYLYLYLCICVFVYLCICNCVFAISPDTYHVTNTKCGPCSSLIQFSNWSNLIKLDPRPAHHQRLIISQPGILSRRWDSSNYTQAVCYWLSENSWSALLQNKQTDSAGEWQEGATSVSHFLHPCDSHIGCLQWPRLFKSLHRCFDLRCSNLYTDPCVFWPRLSKCPHPTFYIRIRMTPVVPNLGTSNISNISQMCLKWERKKSAGAVYCDHMCCIHVCNVDTVYNVFLLKKKII